MSSSYCSYFFKSLGENIDDAIELEGFSGGVGDDRLIAECAAEDAYYGGDGWEWMPDSKDLVVTLCKDGKEIGDFSVQLDFEPVFHCERK